MKLKLESPVFAVVLGVSLALVVVQHALARSTHAPYRHVVSNGSFFFVMLPATDQPRGIAYEVTRDGDFRALWSVDGWYAYPDDVLLSREGKTLVRIREEGIASDGTMGGYGSNALITIYRNGALIAEYNATDLISDLGLGIKWNGVTGNKWLNRGVLRPTIVQAWLIYKVDEIIQKGITFETDADEVFQLLTFEDVLIVFNLETGQVLAKYKMSEDSKAEH